MESRNRTCGTGNRLCSLLVHVELPLFGETYIEVILPEAIACRQVNPGHHVRLEG